MDTTPPDFSRHFELLQQMCRLCKSTNLHGPTHDKCFYANGIQLLYGVSVENEDSLIYPPKLCRPHEQLIERFQLRRNEGKIFETSVHIAEFHPHTPRDCEVCETAQKPKSGRKPCKRRKVDSTSNTKIRYDPTLTEVPSTASSSIGSPAEKGDIVSTDSETISSVMKSLQKMEDGKRHLCLQEIVRNASGKDQEVIVKALGISAIKSIQKMEDGKRHLCLQELVRNAPGSDKEVIAKALGISLSKKIAASCDRLSELYKDTDFLVQMDFGKYISSQNSVILAFLEGVTKQDCSTGGHMKTPYTLACVLEGIYSLCVPRLILPASFMVNLFMYTQTSSKIVSNVLGNILPGGSYSTLQRWLHHRNTVPVPCPSGIVMNAFDNEQIIRYKRKLNPEVISRSSVITSKMFVHLENSTDPDLQKSTSIKPEINFTVKHYEDCVSNARTPREKEEAETKKAIFKETAIKIRDQKLSEIGDLEQLHLKQLCGFLDKAISIVMQEQHDNAQDKIDNYLMEVERDKVLIHCKLCGTDNPRLKRVCESCHQRDGITSSRDEKKMKKAMLDSVLHRPVTPKEIEIDDSDYCGETELFTSGTYNHVESNHKGPTPTVVGDPVFVDPNSSEAVALVARQIGLENGIKNYGGQERTWTFLCCDGRPHSLLQQLIHEATECLLCGRRFLKHDAYKKHHTEEHEGMAEKSKPEFDWFYLRIGAGHYEMNLIRAFIDLNWKPYFESIAESLGFRSDKAKNFILKCKDHHLSWQLVLAFFAAALRELVHPYVRRSETTDYTSTGFLKYYKTTLSSIPNYAYLYMQACRFGLAIINFRIAVRRNNSDLLLCAKYHTKELFFGRNHPHYRNIEIFDSLQRAMMPPDVKKVWDDYSSVTVSNNFSTGQDLDFILEEKNRALKQYVPKGSVPSDTLWQNICRDLEPLEKIRKCTLECLGLVSPNEKGPRPLDLDSAVTKLRQVFRPYLQAATSTAFTSLGEKPLLNDMLSFIEKATMTRMIHIDKHVLGLSSAQDYVLSVPVCADKQEMEKCQSIKRMSTAFLRGKIDQMVKDVTDPLVQHHYKTLLADGEGLRHNYLLTIHAELLDILQGQMSTGNDLSF